MDDNNNQQSADDALEPDNNMVDPKLDEPKLPEDNDPPAAPADDTGSKSPVDEPATDDSVDSDELYQEGVSGATNADDEAFDPDEEPKPLGPES